MRQYIKLLFASWLSRVLLLLGFASAVAIYIPRFTLPTWIPWAILVVAVLVASYDVYKKQQRQIEDNRPFLKNFGVVFFRMNFWNWDFYMFV